MSLCGGAFGHPVDLVPEHSVVVMAVLAKNYVPTFAVGTSLAK
jgi:hypothetical protein